VEYQREGFLLFQAMTEAIKEESVGYLFNLEVKVETAPAVTAAGAAAAAGTAAAQALGAAGAVVAQPDEDGTEKVLVAKGLDGPDRKVPLSYTAPSEDGVGAVVTGEGGATRTVSTDDEDGSGNREERRRAKKKK
jgi:preprotein translocase subunit SecA